MAKLPAIARQIGGTGLGRVIRTILRNNAKPKHTTPTAKTVVRLGRGRWATCALCGRPTSAPRVAPVCPVCFILDGARYTFRSILKYITKPTHTRPPHQDDTTRAVHAPPNRERGQQLAGKAKRALDDGAAQAEHTSTGGRARASSSSWPAGRGGSDPSA